MITMTWPQYCRSQCSCDGVVVQLFPAEAKMLLILLLRQKRLSPTNLLIEMMWPNPDAEPEHPEKLVWVYLSKLRAKLRNAAILQAHWREGFELINITDEG